MPRKVCNFCGRGEREVELLITGINGFICETCARQAYEIAGMQGAGQAPSGSVGVQSLQASAAAR